MKSRAVIFDRKLLLFILLIVVMDIAMMALGPHDSLDRKIYYSGDQARALLARFDSSELRKYFINETLDLGLIFSYTGALLLGLGRVYPKRQWAVFLAVAPGLFDFVETSFILYSLRWPGPHNFFDWLGVMTFLKWTTGIIAILLFAYGAITRRRLSRGE